MSPEDISYICERGYEQRDPLCNINASAQACALCKLGLHVLLEDESPDQYIEDSSLDSM